MSKFGSASIGVHSSRRNATCKARSEQSKVDNIDGRTILASRGLRHWEEDIMASAKSDKPLSFEVPAEQAEAIKKLAGQASQAHGQSPGQPTER